VMIALIGRAAWPVPTNGKGGDDVDPR